ncbi:MAG: hypothetical protein ACI956_001360, partial [Nonlabens sp.]
RKLREPLPTLINLYQPLSTLIYPDLLTNKNNI